MVGVIYPGLELLMAKLGSRDKTNDLMTFGCYSNINHGAKQFYKITPVLFGIINFNLIWYTSSYPRGKGLENSCGGVRHAS